MFENENTTCGQGAVGVSAAIYYYQKSGYNVCLPLVDKKGYDLVLEKDKKFYTVQVKTTRYQRNGIYIAELKSNRPNRTKNIIKEISETDFVFVLCENGDYYSVPFDKLTSRNQFRVSVYESYKNL